MVVRRELTTICDETTHDMEFASPIPIWVATLAAVAAVVLAYFSYRHPLVPLTVVQRAGLVTLRALALGAVLFFLLRPTVMLPPEDISGIVVPILVDVSRSMRVADADGQSRIARATALVERELLPSLPSRFTPEIYAVGEALLPSTIDRLAADARHSNLSAALTAVAERSRGRPVSGVVLLSDGADTTGGDAEEGEPSEGPPVFAVGVGSAEVPDREILGIVAGDPRLDQSSVDLRVSAVSRGFGRTPFQLRVLANGRLLDSRAVSPAADGSPVEEVFTVSPDALNPTVYTAEIASGSGETIGENNAASVLVSPAGRKRRILALNGAPGHEHSFMMRAISMDPGLEVDSVVRKGKNEAGQDTYLVQAGPGRGSALASGFPSTREALYFYDAVVIANMEGGFFARAQLTQIGEFVSERGGGLLVLGGRSFTDRGLIGTPLDDALPVELNDRRGLLRVAGVRTGAHNTVAVTPEGVNHPVMRIGATPDEIRRRWAALPPLAASAPLGGPKPGASVLAVTSAPGGAVYPLVAVQRYGRGRSMVFSGEASWRWRMLQPSTDQSYEYFWRGAMRWLGGSAPDQISVEVPAAAEPGDAVDIRVDVRDRAFQAVTDADVNATLTVPGGGTRPLTLRHQSGASGELAASVRFEQAGLYRVRAEARRGPTAHGAADRWFYVGGRDREFADPRLNEGFLRRVARATNGQYVRAAEVSRIASWLEERVPRTGAVERRDLWHRPWAIALVIVLLSAEWALRRRWGLR
jgi:uncharacterized membrane protein